MTENILLVEDSALDAELLQFCLRRCGVNLPVIHLSDGASAIRLLDKLRSPGPWAATSLIVLDVQLPLQGGFDILKHIRSAPFFEGVPIVILTSVPIEADRMRASLLGASSYMSKAQEVDDYCHVLELTLRRLLP